MVAISNLANRDLDPTTADEVRRIASSVSVYRSGGGVGRGVLNVISFLLSSRTMLSRVLQDILQ